MKLIYTFILALVLTACASSSDNSETKDSNNSIWDTTSAYIIDSIVEEDNIYIPNNEFDENTETNYPSYILMPYQYHGDEITQEMQLAEWYSISYGQLAKSDVAFKKVYDPVVDDDSTQKTGWLVTSSSDGAMLISNVGKLEVGGLNPLLHNKHLKAGQNKFFSLDGVEYRLYATGYKMTDETSDETYIRNYKIYLERLRDDGSVSQQVLYAQPYFNHLDSEVNILFAGDINRDNKPDIIINRIGYNSSILMLYMSDNTGDKLSLIALHEAIGC